MDTTPRFAAALSEHPVAASAVGEVTGAVLEALGPAPDLAVLFVTPPHLGALEDAVDVVRTILSPTVLVGCVAESVVGTGREVEAGAAVSLWAGRVGAVAPARLEARRNTEGDVVVTGLGAPGALGFDPSALVLVADPFRFPVETLFAQLARTHPELPVVGGMASAARAPGGNRLALDGSVVTTGAVGAWLGPGAAVASVVSQGCRPVGRPWAVTRADGQLVYELGGDAAVSRLRQTAERDMSGDDIALVNAGGIHLGLVVDEHKLEFERGDFVVRGVLGAQGDSGALVVGEVVDVGTTVQFHVRDAGTADEDLRHLLSGRRAEGALLFTCHGRGSRLFAVPDHDATVLADATGNPPVAGFFAAGELGPIGGRNFLHGFTASILLFS